MAPRPPPRAPARRLWLLAAACLAAGAAGCLDPPQELLIVCITSRECPPGQGCGGDQLCRPRSELDGGGADAGADGGTADGGAPDGGG